MLYFVFFSVAYSPRKRFNSVIFRLFFCNPSFFFSVLLEIFLRTPLNAYAQYVDNLL